MDRILDYIGIYILVGRIPLLFFFIAFMQGTARYVDYLMAKYGKPYTKKELADNPELKGFFLTWPLRLWYDKCFNENTCRDPQVYKRFRFYLRYTRMLYILTCAFYIISFFSIIVFHFATPAEAAENVYVFMFFTAFIVYIPYAIAILMLIPHGILRCMYHLFFHPNTGFYWDGEYGFRNDRCDLW